MKKIIVVFIALSLFVASSAFAAGRVDAFVYCGLYVQRLMEYNEIYKTDFPLNIESFGTCILLGNEYQAITPMGAIMLNTKTGEIIELSMEFYRSTDTEEKSYDRVIRCCAMMSALECGYFEEQRLPIRKKLGEAVPDTAIEEMVNRFNDGLMVKMYNAAKSSAASTEVFSGKYTYYIENYKPSSSEAKISYLVAR